MLLCGDVYGVDPSARAGGVCSCALFMYGFDFGTLRLSVEKDRLCGPT